MDMMATDDGLSAEAEVAAKVASLRARLAEDQQEHVTAKETHMSWVFLAGDRVYKLKKPVRFPYLDFSTLARREAVCRAELRLNRRLAPDVYLAVEPLTRDGRDLAIGGRGEVVDWLVVMRRLDESLTLERRLLDGSLAPRDVDRVASVLTRFFASAPRARIGASSHLAQWRGDVAATQSMLLRHGDGLSQQQVRRAGQAQRAFLDCHGGLIADRVRAGRIVDGHGDLRPEHIWLTSPIRIIDCLEFSDRLRRNDPLDELAFLHLECARLGAPWAGERLVWRVMNGLHETAATVVFRFYRSYRAALRARLAIAHLLEPNPREPAKWLPLAQWYLDQAVADGRMLRRQPGKFGAFRPERLRHARG